MFRYGYGGRCKVENPLDTRLHQLIGHVLGGIGGNRQNPDLDITLGNELAHAFVRLDLQIGMILDRLADLGRIVIENSYNVKALSGEAAIAQQRPPEIAGPGEQ